MPWVELAFVFVLCHLVGDFLLQTDWQASHKHGGLSRGGGVARKALLAHVLTYTLAFVPALAWISASSGADVLALAGCAALVAVPHLLQDDGRVVKWWMTDVKHTDWQVVPGVTVMVDQTMHLLALFALAVLVSQAT